VFNNLFKITPEPFGLDLSDRSVKIAKLSRKKGKLFLENFGEASIKEGLMENGVILSDTKLADVIRASLNGLKMGALKTAYASCSLPEQKTYLRVVQLPKMSKKETEEAIQWEVEANIPVALNDAYFDWEVISPLRKSIDHLDILISAAPRDLIDSYTELFRKAGIKPLSFEPESLAIARCLIKGGISEKPALIVDLGQTRTNFIIYAGRGLRFTSSVEISEDIMTANIARSMGINIEEAEKLKKEIGMNRDENEKVFEAIVPVMTDLKEQINKYMDFYMEHAAHVHSGGEAIAKVLLSGGGARLKGIEKYLTTALRVPVEIASPWINILEPPLRETPELSYLESIRYATALGLALI